MDSKICWIFAFWTVLLRRRIQFCFLIDFECFEFVQEDFINATSESVAWLDSFDIEI